MFGIAIDWPWVLLIAAGWIGFFVALGLLIWVVGWVLSRRDARRIARRPLAPLVELDLHRAARRRTPHRHARVAHGHIHHHGRSPGGTAA